MCGSLGYECYINKRDNNDNIIEARLRCLKCHREMIGLSCQDIINDWNPNEAIIPEVNITKKKIKKIKNNLDKEIEVCDKILSDETYMKIDNEEKKQKKSRKNKLNSDNIFEQWRIE